MKPSHAFHLVAVSSLLAAVALVAAPARALTSAEYAADAGAGRTVAPDGRLEVQLIVHANGLVSGLRLTQRR